MDDLTELLKRIYDYSDSYEYNNRKPPLFRLTPYEYSIFLVHNMYLGFKPEFLGDLPTYMDVNFELVGEPLLFDGKHIRSDSVIEFKDIKDNN